MAKLREYSDRMDTRGLIILGTIGALLICACLAGLIMTVAVGHVNQ